MKKINIAIADDHNLIVKSISKLLKEFVVIGKIKEASNGAELLKLLKTYKPHIILLDIEMPVMSGIEACKIVRQDYPDIKIIALTMHTEDSPISQMIGAGAHSCLSKNADPELVIDAIENVMDTDFYVTDVIKNALRNTQIKTFRREHILPKVDINEQEKQILKYYCEEKNTKEIGELMHVSSKAIEYRRKKLFDKIGVKTTKGLVRFAVEKGYHL